MRKNGENGMENWGAGRERWGKTQIKNKKEEKIGKKKKGKEMRERKKKKRKKIGEVGVWLMARGMGGEKMSEWGGWGQG